MTKAEKILEKHLKLNDVETMLGKHGTTHKAVINAINEAINDTQCCESDSEQLCQHEWIDARNEVVKSGYVCLKCNNVKA